MIPVHALRQLRRRVVFVGLSHRHSRTDSYATKRPYTPKLQETFFIPFSLKDVFPIHHFRGLRPQRQMREISVGR
ncbi:hypothetical protein DPX39_010028900 [Trypanosoma brucei equiperdum]|uniref:Uncharacterized protein n=1 Tax=Trypanosoma brucei equiperdum TaxID=630700 RepID=A0A3L6LCV6_9TRYP|nr:hypothetical protein DPX39_010028900 [Trypanosoma brucei equiperdum]